MKTVRELAHRYQDGIEVTLRWNSRSGTVSIELADDRDETAHVFAVDPACALDAFHHPFAYAPVPVFGPRDAELFAAIDHQGGGR